MHALKYIEHTHLCTHRQEKDKVTQQTYTLHLNHIHFEICNSEKRKGSVFLW